jgi:hypothetical protein
MRFGKDLQSDSCKPAIVAILAGRVHWSSSFAVTKVALAEIPADDARRIQVRPSQPSCSALSVGVHLVSAVMGRITSPHRLGLPDRW